VSKDSDKPTRRKRKPKIGGILGVGLDNEDGHKRITQGEKFVLVGGSQDTHERMTETMMKTFDKHLETVDPRELGEIIAKAQPR
jgi:hypothetical protein